MSKGGLLRSLRALLDEFRAFGQPELQRLRREAQELREEIDAIKATTQRLRQGEEALVLAQLKRALEQKQGTEAQAAQQQQAAREVVGSLGKHAAVLQEATLQQQAMQQAEQILGQIDLDALLREGLPLKRTGGQQPSEASQNAEKQPHGKPPDAQS